MLLRYLPFLTLFRDANHSTFSTSGEDVMIEVEEGVEVPLELFYLPQRRARCVRVPHRALSRASDFGGYGAADGDEPPVIEFISKRKHLGARIHGNRYR